MKRTSGKAFPVILIAICIYLAVSFFMLDGFGADNELPGKMFWSGIARARPFENVWVPYFYFGSYTQFTNCYLLFPAVHSFFKLLMPDEAAAKCVIVLSMLLVVAALYLLERRAYRDGLVLLPLLFIMNPVILFQLFRFSILMAPYVFVPFLLLFYRASAEKGVYYFLAAGALIMLLFSQFEFFVVPVFIITAYIIIELITEHFRKKASFWIFISAVIAGLLAMAIFMKGYARHPFYSAEMLWRIRDRYSLGFFSQFFNDWNIIFSGYDGPVHGTAIRNIGAVMCFIFFWGFYKGKVPFSFFLPAVLSINLSFGHKSPVAGLFTFFRGQGPLSFIIGIAGAGFMLFYFYLIVRKYGIRGFIFIFILAVIPLFRVLSLFPFFGNMRNPYYFFEAAGIVFFVISVCSFLRTLKAGEIYIVLALSFIELIPSYSQIFIPNPYQKEMRDIAGWIRGNGLEKDRFIFMSYGKNNYTDPEYLAYNCGIEINFGIWHDWLQNGSSRALNDQIIKMENIDPDHFAARFFIVNSSQIDALKLNRDLGGTVVYRSGRFEILDFGHKEKLLYDTPLENGESMELLTGTGTLAVKYRTFRERECLVKYAFQSSFRNAYEYRHFTAFRIPAGEGVLVLTGSGAHGGNR